MSFITYQDRMDALEQDLEEPYYEGRTFPKSHHKGEELKHAFLYMDANGDEKEIITTVQVVWKVTYGSYSCAAECPDDYYDTYDLMDWSVEETLDAEGELVDVKNALTEQQLLEYTSDIVNFIQG